MLASKIQMRIFLKEVMGIEGHLKLICGLVCDYLKEGSQSNKTGKGGV